MLFEFGYITIALVIGILRWQRAETGRERALAILAAAVWPVTYLIQELSPNYVIRTTKYKGDNQ